MKFGVKLVLCIVAIISIILSCSRFFIVRQNFIHSIENSANQNANSNTLERYYLESNIINNIQVGEEVTNEKILEHIQSLYSYMEDNSKKIAVYNEDKEKILSNFDSIDDIEIEELFNKETDNYCLRKMEDKHYMLFSSYWSINHEIIYLINIYDITSIYQERDRQMKEIVLADLVILVVSSIFISIFSVFLTRPIKKLNDTSKKIASGHFKERVKVSSQDEIGELAESFNRMAEQIENKIKSLNIAIQQKDDFINRIYP